MTWHTHINTYPPHFSFPFHHSLMAILTRLIKLPRLHSLSTRSYHTTSLSSSALPQPQLDDDEDYKHFPNNNSPSCLDFEGSRRGVHWVFIGSPSSKKHVYAQMISKLLDVPHISIHSLLKQDISPRSPHYKQIAEAIDHGKLVPESIIFGLLSKRLEDGHGKGETGFILDGIPRTSLQAEILDQLVDIDLVVNFKLPEVSFQAHPSPLDSSMSYRTKSGFPSADWGNVGAEPKVSTSYREQMKSLGDYYQNQKKLMEFQVANAPAETWKGLVAALHLQHANAVHSSRMLTLGFEVT